jgi:adenine-specific DNA methylase
MRSEYGEHEGRQLTQKEAGAYYTPDSVVLSLVAWAVRDTDDRLLDPSCGDGRFIATHRNAVGIEQDTDATRVARATSSLGHRKHPNGLSALPAIRRSFVTNGSKRQFVLARWRFAHNSELISAA